MRRHLSLLLLLLASSVQAQCPSGLTPTSYTTPNGVLVAVCCHTGSDGQPCCDSLGNPCHTVEPSPDCCDGAAGSCFALFNQDGVDPVNFKVTAPNGDTEYKRCIWDGSSTTGHGRCFAPSLENWQGPLNQAAAVANGVPPLRDLLDQRVCLPNDVTIGQTTVYLTCNPSTPDGSPCYFNQQLGSCDKGFCGNSSTNSPPRVSTPNSPPSMPSSPEGIPAPPPQTNSTPVSILFAPLPTAPGLEFTPLTRFLNPAVTFTQCDDDSLGLAASPGTFAAGDVIVGILDGFQQGLVSSCTLVARVITTVNQQNGFVSLETQPAMLTDIFVQVDFSLPTQSGGKRRLLQGPSVRIGTGQLNFKLTGGDFSAVPIVNWDPMVVFTLRFANGAIQELDLELSGSLTVGFQATLDGSQAVQAAFSAGPIARRFTSVVVDIFGVPFKLTPFVSVRLTLSLGVQVNDKFTTMVQATAAADLSVSYTPATGFQILQSQFALDPEASLDVQLGSCSFATSLTIYPSFGLEFGIWAPNPFGIQLSTTVLNASVDTPISGTIRAATDCQGQCGCQPASILVTTVSQINPALTIQGVGTLARLLRVSFPLPSSPPFWPGRQCFPDVLAMNQKCCSNGRCTLPLPPSPAPPPSPSSSAASNPLAACGVGGDVSSISPAATCPPTDGCDPQNPAGGAGCGDFCSALFSAQPDVAGCCVISASCDAGPCAPAACCGFQACIPLLDANEGTSSNTGGP